jgi:hypothetical protein
MDVFNWLKMGYFEWTFQFWEKMSHGERSGENEVCSQVLVHVDTVDVWSKTCVVASDDLWKNESMFYILFLMC